MHFLYKFNENLHLISLICLFPNSILINNYLFTWVKALLTMLFALNFHRNDAFWFLYVTRQDRFQLIFVMPSIIVHDAFQATLPLIYFQPVINSLSLIMIFELKLLFLRSQKEKNEIIKNIVFVDRFR